MATASGKPPVDIVNGRHGGAEMDRGTVRAALGYEKLDERTIAFQDPPLLMESLAHPFVAEGEGAGAARVGRVVTLDHPRDCPPQLTVLPTGKMRLQEFGKQLV